MAKITKGDVKRLAVLARLDISEKTAAGLAEELKKILDYDERLQSVTVNGIEPTDQVTGLEDVWREDRALPGAFSRDELLANAPQTKDGYIKVRRVI